jgi:hypothetical protein
LVGSRDTQALEFCQNGFAMLFLFEVSDQSIPAQRAAGLLSRRNRPVSSLVWGPWALCTVALEAPVGQESVGKADQMPVCHGRPRGPMLVVAAP